MRKIGIIQPNFLPWRGYFDFIQEVDAFVLLDDVQYTVQDWRNRNRIRTPSGGSAWLSVPTNGRQNDLILDVKLEPSLRWRRKHLSQLQHAYGKAPHFKRYFGPLSDPTHAFPI